MTSKNFSSICSNKNRFYPQNFSLTSPILNYVISTSPKAWKKLIQTCKYFYLKNSIFPVRNLVVYSSNCKYDTSDGIYDSSKPGPKLWVYVALSIWPDANFPKPSHSLIPKLYKCNLRSMKIRKQNLTLSDYRFITSSGSFQNLAFDNCFINYNDGSAVTLDILLENFKYLQTFFLHNCSSMFKSDTVKNLIKILPHLNNTKFDLYQLSENFDISTMTEFLLKNETINIELSFDYNFYLSETFKEKVEKCLDKILANPPMKIPGIYYRGFDGSRKCTTDPITPKCVAGGQWLAWSTGTCSDTCSLCGVMVQTRTCTSEAKGCPFTGVASQTSTVRCADALCPFPRATCCSQYAKRGVVGGIMKCVKL